MTDNSYAVVIDFKTKLDSVDAGFRKVSQGEDELIQKTKQLEGGMNKVGEAIGKWTAGLVGVQAIQSSFTAINDATVKYSLALADLSAITGATGKDLEYLNEASKELGKTTLYSASQVAEAFKLVGSVKADLLSNLPALREVTKETITLATASGIDLKTAAETTGTALNQFGVGADQASRFINVLAAGSNAGSAEVADLAESLKYVGPVAASLGLSFEQTVSAIELLAQKGIKGSEAGTGLRSVLLKLQSDTDSKLQPSVVGYTKAIENLAKAGLTATEMNDKFGLVAVTAALALKDTASQAESMTSKITGTTTAYQQAAIQTEAYGNKVKQLSNAFEGLKITIGELASSTGVIDALTNSINGLSAAMKDSNIFDVGAKIPGIALSSAINGRYTSSVGNALGQAITSQQTKQASGIDTPSYLPNFRAGSTSSLDSFIQPIGQLMSKTAGTTDILNAALKSVIPSIDAFKKSMDNLVTSRFKQLDDKNKNNTLDEIFGLINDQGLVNPLTKTGTRLIENPGYNAYERIGLNGQSQIVTNGQNQYKLDANGNPLQEKYNLYDTAKNTDFEKHAAEFIAGLKLGNFQDKDATAALNSLRQDAINNGKAGLNNSGELGVLSEIKKFAETLGARFAKPQEVKITVEPTKDFIVKVANDSYTDQIVTDKVRDYTANQAAIAGSAS